jgi:hypothetical protein
MYPYFEMGNRSTSSKGTFLAIMKLLTFCLSLTTILGHFGDVAEAMTSEKRAELK